MSSLFRFRMLISAAISLLFATPAAMSTSVENVPNSDATTSFPSSAVVLDMITLSDAVYYLKNKVLSCNDDQAQNRTLVSLTHQEVLSARDQTKQPNLRRLQNDDQTQNLFDTLLPEGTTCLHYSHDYNLGTQVLVVRSSIHKYVSVVYSGTDDFTTALMDGEILMGKIGPTSNTTAGEATSDSRGDLEKLFGEVPEDAHVHRGFNSAVFDSEHFNEVLECVISAKSGGTCVDADKRGNKQASLHLESTPYQVYTGGHSLGAADSILLGVALHLLFPSEHIQSINFGCPKIGNAELVYWIDSLQSSQRKKSDGSIDIYRFVNKLDLIPRLPDLIFFQHAGHTLQMSAGGEIRAYYNHFGSPDLGYAGVPFGWNAEPYVLFPLALYAHDHKRYVHYLQDYAPTSNASSLEVEMYFVTDFERIEENEGTETSPTVLESE